MNLNIVGSGFSGVISALMHHKKFNKINLFEMKPLIGGILNEIRFQKSNYSNGCQYLSIENEWYKKIKNIEDLSLIEFDHKYGSYTNLDEKTYVSNDVAGPIFDIDKLATKEFNFDKNTQSIDQKLNFYPKFIRRNISNWIKTFIKDSSIIHEECMESLQASRVFFNKNNDQILDLKKKSLEYDYLLGVPRKYINQNPLKAAIPYKGYTHFFSILKSFLQNEYKINFNNSNNIKVSEIQNKIQFNNSSINIKANDIVLWTSNPVPLFKNLNIGQIENPYIKMKLYHFDLLNIDGLKDDYFYIQVFSINDKILRIYFYTINDEKKILVESLFDSNEDEIKKSLMKIIEQFNLKITFKFIHTSIQLRHILYTIEDKKKFDNFDFYHENIISGAWQIYSRDKKINKIGNLIDKYTQ